MLQLPSLPTFWIISVEAAESLSTKIKSLDNLVGDASPLHLTAINLAGVIRGMHARLSGVESFVYLAPSIGEFVNVKDFCLRRWGRLSVLIPPPRCSTPSWTEKSGWKLWISCRVLTGLPSKWRRCIPRCRYYAFGDEFKATLCDCKTAVSYDYFVDIPPGSSETTSLPDVLYYDSGGWVQGQNFATVKAGLATTSFSRYPLEVPSLLLLLMVHYNDTSVFSGILLWSWGKFSFQCFCSSEIYIRRVSAWLEAIFRGVFLRLVLRLWLLSSRWLCLSYQVHGPRLWILRSLLTLLLVHLLFWVSRLLTSCVGDVPGTRQPFLVHKRAFFQL